MPQKCGFATAILLLVLIYVCLLADVHWLPAKKEKDAITDIKVITGKRMLGASRNDYIITASGKNIVISPGAGILLQGKTPAVISYSSLLHKPLTFDFIQDNAPFTAKSLYLNNSYYQDAVWLILLLFSLFFLRRWSTGNQPTETFFYAFFILMVIGLGYIAF